MNRAFYQIQDFYPHFISKGNRIMNHIYRVLLPGNILRLMIPFFMLSLIVSGQDNFHESEIPFPPIIDTETTHFLFTHYDATEDYPLSQYFNPFSQPRETLNYYGSGDVNNDGQINNNDLIAMQQGVQNDRADIDADGIPSTTMDQNILSNYLNSSIDYLPGQYNHPLQTKQEKDDWIRKLMLIDTLDQHDYIGIEPGSIPDWRQQRFISGNFASQLSLNFWGWEPNSINPETGQPMPADTLWSKYDSTTIARFNLPMYLVEVYRNDNDWAHGMNAILTGDNPLEFNDWNFVEPQTDQTNVSEPWIDSTGVLRWNWNLPPDSRVWIFAPYSFGNGQAPYYNIDMIRGPPIVLFNIDSIGNTSLYWASDNLLLTNPNVGINPEPKISETYELNNYPNPFNNSTTISYALDVSTIVELNVYNMKGALVQNLIRSHQSAGQHTVAFHADHLPSGIYFYRLSSPGGSATGKMSIIK